MFSIIQIFVVIFSLFIALTHPVNILNQQTSTRKSLGINFVDLFSDSLDEVLEPKFLSVLGSIPDYLKGSLIRNGPSVFGALDGGVSSTPARRYDHVFDGLAKLNLYTFKDGEVSFLSKFIKSKWHSEIVEKRNDIPASVSTGPVIPPFSTIQNIIATFTSSAEFDNVPVNVHQIGGVTGPWVGLTDAPVMMEFDPVTLETKRKIPYANSIVPFGSLELFSTAHPITRASKNGKIYTYNYILELQPLPLPGASNIAHIIRTDKDMKREIIGSIPLGQGVASYIHDFSMTENYIILCVWPLFMNIASLANGKGFLPQLEWKGNKGVGTKIYVFNKEPELRASSSSASSKAPIASFEAPPLFAYHHINAYEDVTDDGNSQIVMDVTGYDTPEIISGPHAFAYIHNVKNATKRRLQARDGSCYRYRLPIPVKQEFSSDIGARLKKIASEMAVRPNVLVGVDMSGMLLTSELVRINPNHAGKKYRFSYGFTGFAHTEEENRYLDWALVKLDHVAAEAIVRGNTASGPTAVKWQEPDMYPTEPVFVPNPDGSSEDKGVLLSQVYDGNRRETFLLVLDASNMKELARCYTGVRCPVSFHGQFVGENS